jgi:hypothetical protein
LFSRQVQEVCGKLSSTIQDTNKVNKLKQQADPERIHDLYFQIARGYTDTPQLRVTWLEALSKLHAKEDNLAEAAACQLHIAAIVADFLENNEEFLIDFSVLQSICPGMAEVAVIWRFDQK